VIVARHKRELGPNAIANILAQAEVSRDDFLKSL